MVGAHIHALSLCARIVEAHARSAFSRSRRCEILSSNWPLKFFWPGPSSVEAHRVVIVCGRLLVAALAAATDVMEGIEEEDGTRKLLRAALLSCDISLVVPRCVDAVRRKGDKQECAKTSIDSGFTSAAALQENEGRVRRT